jgi:hypothetical protein
MLTKRKMKKYITYLLLFILGCNSPIDSLEIGEPFDKSTAILDDWTLKSVDHVDNLDLNKPSIDLTTLFGNGSLSVSESSFTYTQSSGPNYFENSGSWDFDDEKYPTHFILNSNTQFRFGKPVQSSNDTLILVLERFCDTKVISSYKYLFTRN